MKSPLARLCGCAALLSMILSTGCDDPEARTAAGDASKQINELKIKLEEAKKVNEATGLSIKAVEDRLMKHVDERTDKINDTLLANHKKLLEQLGQDIEKSRKEALGLADTSRTGNEREQALTKSQVATDLQKMREELKAATDELRKFMDNQLKELYPYAYQPKRLEAAAPPTGNEAK